MWRGENEEGERRREAGNPYVFKTLSWKIVITIKIGKRYILGMYCYVPENNPHPPNNYNQYYLQMYLNWSDW